MLSTRCGILSPPCTFPKKKKQTTDFVVLFFFACVTSAFSVCWRARSHGFIQRRAPQNLGICHCVHVFCSMSWRNRSNWLGLCACCFFRRWCKKKKPIFRLRACMHLRICVPACTFSVVNQYQYYLTSLLPSHFLLLSSLGTKESGLSAQIWSCGRSRLLWFSLWRSGGQLRLYWMQHKSFHRPLGLWGTRQQQSLLPFKVRKMSQSMLTPHWLMTPTYTHTFVTHLHVYTPAQAQCIYTHHDAN